MDPLFKQLYQIGTTDLTDSEILSTIQNEYQEIKGCEDDYNNKLLSLLWRAIGRKRMESIISMLSAESRDIFLHEEALEMIYMAEGIEYTFSFIEKYFGRKFSLIYELDQPLEISSIFDHISVCEERTIELEKCLRLYGVSIDEFNPYSY